MDTAAHREFLVEVRADIAQLKLKLKKLESVEEYHASRVDECGEATEPEEEPVEQGSAHPSINGKAARPRCDLMGQREAAIAVMRYRGAPMRTGDIAREMLEFGFEYPKTANDLANSLFTSFSRGPKLFTKVGKGLWGLTVAASNYYVPPNHRADDDELVV